MRYLIKISDWNVSFIKLLGNQIGFKPEEPHKSKSTINVVTKLWWSKHFSVNWKMGKQPQNGRIEKTDKWGFFGQKSILPDPKRDFCSAVDFLNEGSVSLICKALFQLVEGAGCFASWQLTVSINLPGDLTLSWVMLCNKWFTIPVSIQRISIIKM